MLWVGSIVRGHEDKLSDEIFWRLSEEGDILGWRLLYNARYAVRMDEWEDISRLIAAAVVQEDIPWEAWKLERHRDKLYYLERYLLALYHASRLISNGQSAEEFLDRFFIAPLGLYLCGDSTVSCLSETPLIIIR